MRKRCKTLTELLNLAATTLDAESAKNFRLGNTERSTFLNDLAEELYLAANRSFNSHMRHELPETD